MTLDGKWTHLFPWVTGNALAGLTIGMSFMQRALETTQAGIVLAIIATTPIAVIPLARIVEGERISTRAMAGSVVAVAGAASLALIHHRSL
jgi:drug/metabolite transporter (DMT)-like permease